MQKMQKDDILKILHRRYACKEFDSSKKINKQDFEVILESARLAPSSLGLEPWKFIVITSKDLKEEIAKNSSGNEMQINTCSHLLIACNLVPEVILPDSNYVKKHYPEKVLLKIQAMLKSIRSVRLRDDERLINAYAREQCFLSIGQMTQTAAMLDIDSCIIGGFYARGIKGILNTSINTDDIEISCLITFGYGKEQPCSEKIRKPYDEAVKWLV